MNSLPYVTLSLFLVIFLMNNPKNKRIRVILSSDVVCQKPTSQTPAGNVDKNAHKRLRRLQGFNEMLFVVHKRQQRR